MKKVMFSVAAVLMLAATSCKKDYTCKCTSSLNGVAVGTSQTTIHATKSDAKDACSATASSSSAGYTATTTCELVD